MGEPPPEKNKDHALSGNWARYRECHILPDWLLVYRILKTKILDCEQKILNQSVRNLHLILTKKNSHKCVAVLLCNTLNGHFVVISMRVRPEIVF